MPAAGTGALYGRGTQELQARRKGFVTNAALTAKRSADSGVGML